MSPTTMGSGRVVWVCPDTIRSISGTARARSSSSETEVWLVPLWDRQMINSAPCSSSRLTQRWAAWAGSSSTKLEVGALAWAS